MFAKDHAVRLILIFALTLASISIAVHKVDHHTAKLDDVACELCLLASHLDKATPPTAIVFNLYFNHGFLEGSTSQFLPIGLAYRPPARAPPSLTRL